VSKYLGRATGKVALPKNPTAHCAKPLKDSVLFPFSAFLQY